MTAAIEHDVVIAGLGPTGLVLAHTLGQQGVNVLVLEREPATTGQPMRHGHGAPLQTLESA
ncbi:MAG: hypothetical protein ABT02_02035 [Comamonadaceae bacterium SCN 68-20]|jgi:flavin-dependent dehydrogenase|nr:MAG: hypothetical protein ABT02_02035 [Comamonadaceae bacterium SCN 68-20]OJX04488.1 MAG: hypothetical protein BGO75_13365 [Burkholderiales bacterium 68-20]